MCMDRELYQVVKQNSLLEGGIVFWHHFILDIVGAVRVIRSDASAQELVVGYIDFKADEPTRIPFFQGCQR